MLTPEQIKNLKPGDPVIIHGTFLRQCTTGDILCKVTTWHGGDDFGIAADSHVYARPRCVSLPSEIVTPVEELEPYYIETETFDYEIRNENDDPDIGTIVAFHVKFQDPDERLILNVKSYYESYVYSSEHAEADAEAECARLNEEWRKEQNHDK